MTLLLILLLVAGIYTLGFFTSFKSLAHFGLLKIENEQVTNYYEYLMHPFSKNGCVKRIALIDNWHILCPWAQNTLDIWLMVGVVSQTLYLAVHVVFFKLLALLCLNISLSFIFYSFTSKVLNLVAVKRIIDFEMPALKTSWDNWCILNVKAQGGSNKAVLAVLKSLPTKSLISQDFFQLSIEIGIFLGSLFTCGLTLLPAMNDDSNEFGMILSIVAVIAVIGYEILDLSNFETSKIVKNTVLMMLFYAFIFAITWLVLHQIHTIGLGMLWLFCSEMAVMVFMICKELGHYFVDKKLNE